MRSRHDGEGVHGAAGAVDDGARDGDDYSIALLDAYACMADVLSFYQERIANENYLRTAGERLSLSQLARLIDYRLRPGVAAESYLAFTMESPPPQAASPNASGAIAAAIQSRRFNVCVIMTFLKIVLRCS